MFILNTSLCFSLVGGETFYIVDFSSLVKYRDSVYYNLIGTSSAGNQSGSSTTELTPEQLREKRLK